MLPELNQVGNQGALDLWKSVAFCGEVPEAFVPFAFYLPLTKGVADLQPLAGTGNWKVEGPLSDPGEDLEGEEMDQAGLEKGLATFFRLNGPVDWDHLWEKTREPKWLIGRGLSSRKALHPVTGNMVPFLLAEIFADKDVARQAIDHYQKGGSLGYSVAGGVVKKAGNRILEPIVTSVALTPVPVVSANTGTVQLVKSLGALRRGEIDHLPVAPELMERLTPFPVYKALSALAALPHTGPGVSAAMTEDLDGAENEEKKRLLAKALGLQIASRLARLQAQM